MAETMVRMGEMAVSRRPGDVLTSLGLGSCIGLALVDSRSQIAGLAHVVLPSSDGRNDTPGKYADTAVEALLGKIVALGGRKLGCQAVLAGGASMFAFAKKGTMEVGARNDEAVRAELARLRIPVAAHDTGGGKGRSIRVEVEGTKVLSRAAGAPLRELFAARRAMPGRTVTA
jgi:chemotaxis protein CheD